MVPFASTTDNQTTEALERKNDKGPDDTAKEDVIDTDEGVANAEPDDFEDLVAVTVRCRGCCYPPTKEKDIKYHVESLRGDQPGDEGVGAGPDHSLLVDSHGDVLGHLQSVLFLGARSTNCQFVHC